MLRTSNYKLLRSLQNVTIRHSEDLKVCRLHFRADAMGLIKKLFYHLLINIQVTKKEGAAGV